MEEKIICPECRSENVARILYGLPDFDAIQEGLENKTIVLGGCCMDLEDPDYYCNICKIISILLKEWIGLKNPEPNSG